MTVMAASHGRAVMAAGAGGHLIPPPGVTTFGTAGPYVYDAQSALHVPAVARAVQLYSGLVKQCPLDAFRGPDLIDPTPRLVQQPDPDRGATWFVHVSVEDYLLMGNAISLVTQRGADGWPLTVQWLPALWVYVQWTPWAETAVNYFYLGGQLNPADVIHVRRGADRTYPVRGVGVVEQFLSSLDRMAMQEEYERGALEGGAVPSVAVITPQAQITQPVADDAKARWADKFAGPQREPVFLPAGTQVVPLGWSPSDAQLTEARRLSLVDVANMFSIDSYWLSAPNASMTYRTAAPQYQQILRTSLEPVMVDFEDIWSQAWLPRGSRVEFRRRGLLREDLATSMQAAQLGYVAGFMTDVEARQMVGLPAEMEGELKPAPAPPAPPAVPAPAPDDQPPPADEGGSDAPTA
jgi:HK97 family phage portal protein